MLFSITLTSGCATYVRDRMADAGDIFTATVGTGIGVTAKAGPIHTGLGYGLDLYGLRGGTFGSFVTSSTDDEWPLSGDGAAIIAAIGGFVPDDDRACARGKAFASAYFADSKKLLPFLDLPWDADAECHPAIDPQWTQIDLSVGLIASVRLGFNPGELLDFIVGLVGFDLYGDDLAGAGGDWEALAQQRREKGWAKRRATRQSKLRFEEWSAAGVAARRDWGGWRPDMGEVSSSIPDGSFRPGENEEGWRVMFPVPDHRDWTNSCHVVVHVHATPAQARQDLFNAVDDAMSNLGKTRREGPGFPGEICFSAESGRHLFFARDCIMVSIHDYSYGRGSHALQLARALGAQIQEALLCVGR